VPTTQKPLAIYIHWPFCVSKCPYCDFNSHVREQIDPQSWSQAYYTDLKNQSQFATNHQVQSIFFGGGTPSLMPPSIIEDVVTHIHKIWPVASTVEVTMEANPHSSEINKFQSFQAAGINRISLGIQSLIPETLKFLGRAHSKQEALKAIEMAQKIFETHSLDFIYAHPKHTPEEWQKELKELLSFQPPHLSLYQLTIEPQTPFQSYERLGKFKMPSALASEKFFDETIDTLKATGYEQYEVSNFSKPTKACQHNMAYWRSEDYLGIGPGAHGRYTKNNFKVAARAHRSPEKWLELIKSKGCALTHQDQLTREELLEEMLLMGLRLTSGISTARLNQVIACDFWEYVGPQKKTHLYSEGLLEDTGDGFLKTTALGLKKLNAVLNYLLIH